MWQQLGAFGHVGVVNLVERYLFRSSTEFCTIASLNAPLARKCKVFLIKWPCDSEANCKNTFILILRGQKKSKQNTFYFIYGLHMDTVCQYHIGACVLRVAVPEF